MAFAYTLVMRISLGNMVAVIGTWTNGAGDSGGDIYCGLSRIEAFFLQPYGAAVIANQVMVNETSWPKAGDGVTIVTNNGDDGLWLAIGYD
jgi:hypothetical protein